MLALQKGPNCKKKEKSRERGRDEMAKPLEGLVRLTDRQRADFEKGDAGTRMDESAAAATAAAA